MIHLPALISDLALILGAAAVVTILFRWLKQPLVLGYIIAGFLVGPHFHLLPTIHEIENIQGWADIGVIFLLFGLGLEFSFKKLVKVGGTAAITAIIEVMATMAVGYGIGKLMGWSFMDCIFFGGILCIASTTIIIRAFGELGVKSQQFASVVLGVLIIEDLVAVLLMVLLSTVAVSQQFEGAEMIASILKLAFFLGLWFLSGIFFIPSLLKRLQTLMNDEMMLIFSLALCFGMVFLAAQAGFSSALGAFIMGSILAETLQGKKIESLLTPVKNLFGAIFFVSVGMMINPQMMVEYSGPIIAGVLVLLIGKPMFVTIGAVISGQPLKTSIQSGMSLSQIGEFSFIIATLGLTLQVTSNFLYPIAVAISVITAFTTPYMIRLSEPFYKGVQKILPENWKEKMVRYSAGAQAITSVSDWRLVLRSYITNIVVNSLVILGIILLSLEYLNPLFSNNHWGSLITIIISLLFMAPFLWGLTVKRTDREAHTRVWTENKFRGPMVMLEIVRMGLGVLFIGILSDRLFTPVIAWIAAAVIIILLLVFSRRLQSYYFRIENRFLENLHENETMQKQPKPEHELAPWDAHFAQFEIEADSPAIGKTLEELQLREQFDINIAMIERGSRVITVPSRDERIFPGDLLSAIGTDEQLKAFRFFIEAQPFTRNKLQQKQDVVLKQLVIKKDSFLLGQNIRESGIRERAKGIVAGIERNGNRILNPPSSLVFEEDDIVWVVGNVKRLLVLANENRKQKTVAGDIK
ncbi:MAG: cation:proton antiporter [Chitinophagaceae bacterium]|nr:cation:proton antiporter [Chitinophagaceae bacterium]